MELMNRKIAELMASASKIVIVQADNPDADSLGSALALEQILGEMGKSVALYCGVDMPGYLHYLPGWDRVLKDLPSQFDLSIIVDASTYTLLEKLEASGQLAQLMAKPSIVLDHHALVEKPLDFASVSIVEPNVASTGELIFNLASELNWPLDKTSGEFIMASILGDTQGLTNDLTKSSTYTVMAALVELGVDRPALEEARREFSKMSEKIYRYKAELIDRTELAADGQIASVTVPQAEINEFSPLYNPAALIQFDMLQIEGVKLAIVFKHYDNDKVTGAIRASYGFPIAGQLAEAMGGGGHAYASGFKIEDGTPFDQIKSNCLAKATELLATINQKEI